MLTHYAWNTRNRTSINTMKTVYAQDHSRTTLWKWNKQHKKPITIVLNKNIKQ